MPGYISLHRDVQKHWLYSVDRVFSGYEAWLDILLRVNHTEGKVTHNGTLETVSRGSTIWSMGDMEKHWKWSNSKVRAFLKRLENDEMITVKSTTKKTYLSVVNYDNYQEIKKEEAPPKHHQNTTETPTKHTNNNVNNNKEKDMPDFDKFWSLYPRKIEKADALSAWGNVIKRGGLPEDVFRAVEIYKAEIKKDKTETIYIKHPASFLNKDRWKEKLIVTEPTSKKHTNVYELPLNLSPELIEKMRVDQEQAVKDFYDLSKLRGNDYPDTFKSS